MPISGGWGGGTAAIISLLLGLINCLLVVVKVKNMIRLVSKVSYMKYEGTANVTADMFVTGNITPMTHDCHSSTTEIVQMPRLQSFLNLLGTTLMQSWPVLTRQDMQDIFAEIGAF
jgi:hypothetical protein